MSSAKIRIEKERANSWCVRLEKVRGYLVGSGLGVPLKTGLPNRASATMWWIENKPAVLDRYAAAYQSEERMAPAARDRVR